MPPVKSISMVLHGLKWSILAFFLVAMSLEVLGPSFYELNQIVWAADGYENSCWLNMKEKRLDELDAGQWNVFLEKERLVDGNIVSTAHGAIIPHIDGHDDLVHGVGFIVAGTVTGTRLFISAMTASLYSGRRCRRTGRERQQACIWLRVGR